MLKFSDDLFGPLGGAALLYNECTGALISAVYGKTNDQIGYNGVLVLANGNYLVLSPYWADGAGKN